MKEAPADRPEASGLRIVLLRARFNDRIVAGLVAGAREALRDAGVPTEDVAVVDVPGAFELPLAALAAARSGRFDAIVALGAVIRGDTDHYEHVAREASSGLAAVSRETGMPVAFGVLTVREEAQALARSAPGPENKGAEAARAAVAMVHALRALSPREAMEARRHGQRGRRPGTRATSAPSRRRGSR
jgi:6,7-dimethyl-8-ribityllumazine synthase